MKKPSSPASVSPPPLRRALPVGPQLPFHLKLRASPPSRTPCGPPTPAWVQPGVNSTLTGHVVTMVGMSPALSPGPNVLSRLL